MEKTENRNSFLKQLETKNSLKNENSGNFELVQEHVLNKDSRWVHLNVGGMLFITTRSTLVKDPETFFFPMCQENWDLSSTKDETGAYLIDRDPQYFGTILNYLRHGKLVLDKDVSEEGVLEEAEFFNIKPLIKLLKEKISIRDRDEEQVENAIIQECISPKHSNQVLQCGPNELPSMLTTLSSDWKIEQVMNIDLPTHRLKKRNADVFCVISRQDRSYISQRLE